MLAIRLARHGRKKRPFCRIVLTEHHKAPQAGYKEVVGWFDPLKHDMEANVERIKELIGFGAKPSERVAKLLFKKTDDALFQKYFVLRQGTKTKKKED